MDILKPNQVSQELKKEGGINSSDLGSPAGAKPFAPKPPIIPKPPVAKPEFFKPRTPVSSAAPDSIQGPSISAKGPFMSLRKPKILLENVEIRTMEKDIKRLGGKGMTEALREIPKFKISQPEISKKAEPPKGLPVIEPIRKPAFPEIKPGIPLPPEQEKAAPLPPRFGAFPKSDLSPLLKLKKAKEEKEMKETAGQGKKNVFKMAIIGSAAVLILAAAGGGFYYWWKFLRTPATYFQCQQFQCVEIEGEKENECLTNNDCLPPEPEIPLSLITADKTETIDYSTDPGAVMQDTPLRMVQEKFQIEGDKGTINRILIKTINEDLVKEYASLSQFIQISGIIIPSNVSANFSGQYTFFAYIPDSEEAAICQQSQISDSQCSGPRLGLAVKISDKEMTKQAMANWQMTMVDDLKPLILSQITKTNGFKTDANPKYQGKVVYYQNLPISPIALNYALSDDLLLIGTSKNCLYQALDRLGAE